MLHTENDEWNACQLQDDDYCFIYFAYNYDTDEVRVQRTRGSIIVRHFMLTVSASSSSLSRPLPFNRGRTISIRWVAWVGPLDSCGPRDV